MAWRRPGDRPLSEPMMVSLLTHIHWNENVFILMKSSSLTALKIVKMTTFGVASEENFIKVYVTRPQWFNHDAFNVYYKQHFHTCNKYQCMQFTWARGLQSSRVLVGLSRPGRHHQSTLTANRDSERRQAVERQQKPTKWATKSLLESSFDP